MGSKPRTLAQTAEFILGRRPALASLINTFLPVMEARDKAALEIAPALAAAGKTLPPFPAAEEDLPLLQYEEVEDLGPYLGAAAEFIVPSFLKIEIVAPYESALFSFFRNANPIRKIDSRILAAVNWISEEREAMEAHAWKAGIPGDILSFVTQFTFSAVLRALVANALATNPGDAPWDGEGAWQYGYCPVCGSDPIIAWLDRRSFDEKNAYLSGGGGKKHFHCGLCGANWKFRRGLCPACGHQGEGAVNILSVKDVYGERVDWCAKCQTYSPTTDLRELEYIPNMDMMALGMAHLDMLAAEKGLIPLAESFWNKFA